MSFLTNFFQKEKFSFNKVLIDVGPHSVAGAYARYRKGEKPAILALYRLPITSHPDEAPERAMLRTLHALGEKLIQEGAPHLARATGNGAADAILASVDAPWAITALRVKRLNPREPLIFSRELANEAMGDRSSEPGRFFVDESIVGTALNGYATREPYGKQASYAVIAALISHVSQAAAAGITACLRNLFHIDRISLIASGSLRHQAALATFMHERSAGILDALGSSHTLFLIQRGIPVSLTPIRDANSFLYELTVLGKRFSLPQTLFILEPQHEPYYTSLQEMHAASPLAAISVRPSHLIEHVSHAAPTPPDLPLLLMALHGENYLALTS